MSLVRRFGAACLALACAAGTQAVRAQQVQFDFTGGPTDPIACEGIVYFGTESGKLYAVHGADGALVEGFPVDIGVAMGDGSYSLFRPSVFYGAHGKAIYIGTSKGGVMKIWPNGTVAWVNTLTPGKGATAPAVTPDGEVIAPVTTTKAFVVKLRELDGSFAMTSPPLSLSSNDGARFLAVIGGNIYTSVLHAPDGNDIIVLNQADLTVKATVRGTGADWAPPYVRGNGVFYGRSDNASGVFKLNSATLAPDAQFGSGGFVVLGPTDLGAYTEVSGAPRSADRDAVGTIYASVQSSNIAKVVGINSVTGSVRTLFSATDGALGMVVGANNVAAYGSGNTFNVFSINGGAMRSYTLAVRTSRPAYDPTTNRFFVTTSKGSDGMFHLYGFDGP